METCYMCSQTATSKEHIPPKCIFPEKKDLPPSFNFRKNLITVPSCEEHNSKKSMDDEYLLFCILSSFQGNEHKTRNFESKLMRAVERKPHVYAKYLETVRPAFLVSELGVVERGASFNADLGRYVTALSNIARGLYFHHTRDKWLSGARVFSNALINVTSANAAKINANNQAIVRGAKQLLKAEPSYGKNPEIFAYKIMRKDPNSYLIVMIFYEKHDVLVWLK